MQEVKLFFEPLGDDDDFAEYDRDGRMRSVRRFNDYSVLYIGQLIHDGPSRYEVVKLDRAEGGWLAFAILVP